MSKPLTDISIARIVGRIANSISWPIAATIAYVVDADRELAKSLPSTQKFSYLMTKLKLTFVLLITIVLATVYTAAGTKINWGAATSLGKCYVTTCSKPMPK